jgi:hypothetical protein
LFLNNVSLSVEVANSEMVSRVWLHVNDFAYKLLVIGVLHIFVTVIGVFSVKNELVTVAVCFDRFYN